MTQVEKTVFISYRRTNIFTARAIYQNLTQHGYDVFFDYENIDSGDFSQQILQSIESRAHFLLILTPSALERCREPDDWVRREIEHAIKFKRNIVPLTLENFDFDEMSEYLPIHIGETLGKYNALKVPTGYFEEAMKRLRERFLSKSLNMILHPRDVDAETMEQKQKQNIKPISQSISKTLSAEEFFERGSAHHIEGDYDRAIKEFSEAINLKSDYADAYSKRGFAYAKKGNYLQAIQNYNQAIFLNPRDIYAYHDRAVTYVRIGKIKLAIADYNEAIRLKPNYAIIYFNRGEAHRMEKNYNKAVADYSKAIRLKSDYVMAYEKRAQLRMLEKSFFPALRDYKEAIRLSPREARLYLKRANIYIQLEYFEAAIMDYDDVILLNPEDAKAYNTRGFLHEKISNYDFAIADYKKAVEIQPDYKLAHRNLAKLKSHLNK